MALAFGYRCLKRFKLFPCRSESAGVGDQLYSVRGYCGAKQALGNSDFLALLARQAPLNPKL